ncbi:MAG: CehA/McbA family metallohydrolase [Pseudobutyrivibrio sp.]|uniref:CehA/McbA family metallohydrolase n=1 Tax=Pseudobutyrivibrio sp. TaxID=2014367 RepID=UPI0025DF5EF8|nr:CehA/McbA family metallohydrolase [Pseudobutyrivibrio sp.]MBQ8489600.1 CehA/McbA family metallohydrolase [Pseudobutyrivibrio sp.]
MKKLARRGLSLVLAFLMIATTAYSDMSFVSRAEETNHVWTKVSLGEITSSDSIAIAITTSDGETYVMPSAAATKTGPGAVPATVNGNELTVLDGKDSDYAWTVSTKTVEETVVADSENNSEAKEESLEEKSLTDVNTEVKTVAEDNSSSKEEESATAETVGEEATDSSKEEVNKVSAEGEADLSLSEATEEKTSIEEEVQDEKEDEKKEETVTKTYYTFASGSNYLYTTASNNGIRVSSMPGDEVGARWELADCGYLSAKDSKGVARYLGVYNKKDFRAYTSPTTNNIKNQSVGFYKLTEKSAGDAKVAAPTASIESGEAVDFGTAVTLETASEDAKIYYNVNGSEDNYSPYKEAIVITKDTTIYAYATNGDEKSEIVSFSYTLKKGSKITDITKLDEEQEFVLAFNDASIMSTTAKSSKLEPVAAKLNDDKLLTYEEAEAPIAKLSLEKAEVEGEYYITTMLPIDNVYTKHYLTTGSTGNNLSFVTEKTDCSAWSFEAQEDGTYLIKNAKAAYKNSPQYMEFYSRDNLFTTYSYTAGKSKIDAYKFSAYTVPEVTAKAEEPTTNTVGKLLTRELYDGDEVVVYFPGSSKVMTAEENNGKLKEADATISEDGTLETKGTGAVVLKVALDDNGNYSFKTADDKYLTIDLVEKESNGKTKTYANLTFKDTLTDNGLWTEVAADDNNSGKYYLKNAFAKVGSSQQALEYYSGFSAYGFKEDAIYAFNFYALAEGEKTVKLEYEDERLTVGQWAGNAHYNEYEECATTIYGDKYATNDMLDKTAKYTAVVDGAASKPWTSATSTTTGSTSYYMGSTGVANAASDYMQFELSTLGYGNLGLEFRMRASNTAAGSFQLQYSTDGENFKNFKTGTYSYKYTAYKNSGKTGDDGKAIMEPFEVNGSGDITDGIAKTSLAPTYYVNFTFDIPNAAANAEKVYIRLVPGELSAKGDKAPSKGGVIRMDGVVVKGNPVVDNTRTRFVVANPTSGEVAVGEKIALTSLTEGADVYYSVNGSEFAKYNPDEKVTLNELPATVQAYAVKEGLEKSITVSYMYTQAQVAAVKATPNGGAVIENQKVTLKSKTEDATILYRYMTDEEIAAEEKTSQENAESETKEETVNEHDDWITYTGSFELKSLPCQIQVKATKEGYKDSAVATVKFTKRLNDKYNIYFGQIHAHTNISDGAGSLEDALKHATNVDNLDYIVITDHSNSIDNEKESKITENVDKAATDEWTYAHNLVKQYSTDKFTCAYGYEMTWSNGLGHMNTYNTPGFQSRTQTEFSTYSTALQNYYAALRTVPDSISQFNHPGTTFGDFSDFAYYSEENDNLITMIEVGNGEGTIGSSGYFPSYEYYTRALDKGWHVAPTNNQDNHKGKWGDANTARTVMLADVNDENAIYDAMRNYRIYATEDNDLSIYYTLNSYIMGTILEKDAVDDTVEIKADIKDPTDSKIGRVEVIVNGGQSIAMENVSTNDTTVTFNVPSSYSYYYLKITEDDGDIAVTAPVWVGEVEACGINKTYTNTVLPVKGESLDVNVDLYNNESSDLKIDFVDVVLKDVDGKETEVAALTGEEAGVPSVEAKGTATFKTDYVYNEAGQVTYEITVRATLNGVPKVYTDKLTVNYALPSMIADIVIDGTHYNDYVTGYYGGNVNAFIKLCAAKNIRATVVKDEITADTLKNCKLLVVAAPAKKSGTANAGDYKVSHYSDEFIALVKDYVANGGSVAVCGLADYSDSTDCQTATEQNKLLSAIGATIRMGSDEVCDDKNNGGQVYRMYPTNVNLDSELLAGFKEGQKYSQYSGCSVDISNAKANDFVDAAEWLVKGYDTTYSVDCKDENGKAVEGVLENGVKGKKNDNEGNVTFLARQKTKAGGQIIVAGGVFLSDFEVKAEMDNNDSLPYVNHTIVNNILDGSQVELPVSTIAEARKGAMNEVFAVEGYVTSGTDNENTTFFDTIYLQDETAGIDIFPYATPGLAIGTKMRIVGYVSQYQGDKELKVISYKILKDEPYIYAPKKVDTKTAMDYEALGGSLLETEGKVTRVAIGADGAIEEFWLMDDTGVEAAIFIDGYIKSATTGKNELADFVKVGATVSAVGVLYKHPEGDSDVSVPVFRVRNCDDIKLVGSAPSVTPGGNGGNSGNSGSSSNPIAAVIRNINTAVDKAVDAIIAPIADTPVGRAVRNVVNRFRAVRDAILGNDNEEMADDTTEDVTEETTEEETVSQDPQPSETIADEQVPEAAPEEKEFPVVPVAAASVIIIAGVGVTLAGKFGLLAKLLGK